MQTQTLFEKIITGDIPSVKLHEDDICIVIMDKFPMETSRGQCLVIPKTPTDLVFNLSDEIYSHCFLIAKQIAKAIEKSSLQPERVCLLVEGFEVPHAHIKIYPVYERRFVDTHGTEKEFDELEAIAGEIKKTL